MRCRFADLPTLSIRLKRGDPLAPFCIIDNHVRNAHQAFKKKGSLKSISIGNPEDVSLTFSIFVRDGIHSVADYSKKMSASSSSYLWFCWNLVGYKLVY